MNRGKARYPILLLDADDTLFDFQKAEQNALRQLLEKCGYPYACDVLNRYRRINELLWRRYEEGKIGKDELQATRFSRLFAELSIMRDGKEANERYLDYLSDQGCLMDGALEVCKKLAPFCRLYIVTNGISRVQRKRLENSPLRSLILDIFVSEDTGSQKPQTAFFDYVFERIPDFSQEKALIVGDSLTSDVRGGMNAGIDTCWYHEAGKGISEAITPTYEISDLDQLPKLIIEQ